MLKPLALICVAFVVFGAEPSPYVTRAEVEAAVRAMDPARPSVNVLLKTIDEGNYRVSLVVVRRIPQAGMEEPGQAHERITEMYQIVSGSGEMETGGTEADTETVDLKPAVGPTLRGRIVGAKVQKVGPGDTVMILPHVPHRFSHLDGTIVYLATRIEAIHK